MRLFKSKLLNGAVLPVLTLALLTACNKKEEKAPEAAPKAAAPAAAAAVITVTANDQMQFSVKAIDVTAGSPVVIILQNVGTMAKEVMGHDFTILQPGTDLAAFATKAMAAKETDYIPASESASIFAHTKLLGAGESDTLKFTAPAAGAYPFLCTFPGHYAVMQGVMTVK
jgi:azurin